jgi:hypothetical protein
MVWKHSEAIRALSVIRRLGMKVQAIKQGSQSVSKEIGLKSLRDIGSLIFGIRTMIVSFISGIKVPSEKNFLTAAMISSLSTPSFSEKT